MDELQMVREAYGEPTPPTLREMTEARAAMFGKPPRPRIRFGWRLRPGDGVGDQYEQSVVGHRVATRKWRGRAWDDPDWATAEYTGPVPRKLLSPFYAPRQRALCMCRGCSPFVLDDGVRRRAPVLGTESSAFVGAPLRRRTVVTQLVDAEREKEAVMARTHTCGKCGGSGHNARGCEQGKQGRAAVAGRVAVAPNGADPIVASIDARIAELRAKIEALETAKAALAE